jgi:uncharacterized membrane protein (UPF0127 family)
MASTRFILNTAGWDTVCERAVLADTAPRRMRGLLGRSSLPAGEGILLHPERAIHTAFMRFPIDVVFLDRELRVMKVVEQLPPWRIASDHSARSVLELAAGEARRLRVEPGHQLLALIEDPSTPARDHGSPSELRGKVGEQPMTVLVASGDRRFRVVASALLERRGCRVAITDDPEDATRLVRSWSPDVVLLDADRSLAAPAQVVARLCATAPHVGVVLVGEGFEEPIGRLIVRPKWGVFDDLVAAIDDANWRRGSQKIPA